MLRANKGDKSQNWKRSVFCFWNRLSLSGSLSMLNVRTSVSAGDTAWCMSAFSVWQLSQHSLTPFTFTPHPILLLPIWRIGWAEYRWRWLVLPVCCPFNSRALIFPKCALPWENGHTFFTMGITNSFFFFLQKKLVIQGKHIAMHYSNPRPKFEDWLCNKVSMCSSQINRLSLSLCPFVCLISYQEN